MDRRIERSISTTQGVYRIATLVVSTSGEELFVYLSISPNAVSAVLIRVKDQVQKPVYYVSKVLMGAENRYLKIEKLTYALLIASRKLCHYFQAHPITVLIDQPLKQILQRPRLANQEWQ